MKRGLFITVEGADGSGKSTQIEFICEYLERKNIDYIFTREPGGTPISEKIRAIILDKDNSEMDPVAEALLYAASKAQHVNQLIGLALERGKVVICDRFVDSSIAYQGYGRSLGELVSVINSYAIGKYMPDITFLFELQIVGEILHNYSKIRQLNLLVRVAWYRSGADVQSEREYLTSYSDRKSVV